MKRIAYNYIVKCVLIGMSGVGKTTVLKLLTENTFEPIETSDIKKKCRIHHLEFSDITARLILWDNPADVDKKSSSDICYYMFFYDVTNRESFDFIKNKVGHIQKAYPNSTICLVGNKTDLGENRMVSSYEGNKLALEYGCEHIEISAATSGNISELFDKVAKSVIQKLQEDDTSTLSVVQESFRQSEVLLRVDEEKNNPIFDFCASSRLLILDIDSNNSEQFEKRFDEVIKKHQNIFQLRNLLEELTKLCKKRNRIEFKKALLEAYSEIRIRDARSFFWKANLLCKIGGLFSTDHLEKTSKVNAANSVLEALNVSESKKIDYLPEAATQGLLERICRI